MEGCGGNFLICTRTLLARLCARVPACGRDGERGGARGSREAEEFDLAADFVAGGGSGVGEGGVFAGAFEDEDLTREDTESTEVRRRRPPYDDVNGHERHEKHESCDVKNVAARRNWRSSHRKGRGRIGFGMVARERHFWEC